MRTMAVRGIQPIMFMLLVLLAFGPAAEAQEQTGSARSKYLPLVTGSEWTYQLTIPAATRVPVAAFFIEPDGLLATSITNGMLQRNAGSWTIHVRVIDTAAPSVVRVDIPRELLSLWFAVEMTEIRMMVTSDGSDTLALEIHGSMKMQDAKTKPWILGQRLALLPANESKPAQGEGYLAELSTDPVVVGAGRFPKTVHSRETRGDGRYAAKHIVETWLAEGIGLVKLVVAGTDGKPIYTLELKGYKGGK
jgi:hypothetical protein